MKYFWHREILKIKYLHLKWKSCLSRLQSCLLVLHVALLNSSFAFAVTGNRCNQSINKGSV